MRSDAGRRDPELLAEAEDLPRPPVRVRARVEFAARGKSITIYDCQAPWAPSMGPEWTRTRNAQLRYDAEDRRWRVYCAGSNSRWHFYDLGGGAHRAGRAPDRGVTGEDRKTVRVSPEGAARRHAVRRRERCGRAPRAAPRPDLELIASPQSTSAATE